VKILVDQEELNRAFDIVSDVKNAIESLADGDMISTEEYGGLLQKACNILGPMWADGTDARKVLVEREFLKDCIHELNHNKRYGINNVMLVIQRLLKDNPDSSLDEDSIDQEISDSAWKFVQGNTPYDITDDDRRWADQAIEKHLEKHDDSQIPVRSKEQNIQAIKEALAKDPGKIFISPLLDPEDKPDPRCNGCEFQHPFAELLSYDTTNQLVYCGRDTNPSYHSEGRKLRHPPGTEKPQGIKMCHIYYLNNGELAKFGTEWNPPCAQYCIPEIEKIMEREVDNHLAIIEILNILDSSSCSRGWDRTTELRNKVKALKAKIVKGEEII
jgi:hypothetical protein